jgi:hypothetical protein
MRPLSLLVLLAACDPGTVKVEDSGGGDDTAPVVGDSDGDGHASLDAGGDDCDDANPLAYPGAPEVWYDGVDQACDGGTDYDQDGDGADAAPEGADCDDLDAALHPGAPESWDLLDQDCDGVADEDFVIAGAVVVSEVMHHPLTSSDADGEWFELTNTATAAFDLKGWTISADDGDAIVIEDSLVIAAGGRVVLGPNGNTGLNGGVTVDYVYDRASLSLSADDTLFLGLPVGTVFDMEWTGWEAVDGRSLSLDPDHTALTEARQAGYWCTARTALSGGDYGTPGAENDDCTSLDEDGDGYSVDEGDCNDDNATISPARADVWDGIDNDCSGAADDGDAGDASVATFDGPANNGFLGVHAGLGVGDVTGDGVPDLMIGGALQGSYRGAMYVIDGTDASGDAGDVDGEAIATISGTSAYYFGATSPRAGDVTGDGIVDLVIAAGSTASGFGGPAISVYEGGAGLSGTLDSDDGDLEVSGGTASSSYGDNRVISYLDLNGDGLADIVYGQPLGASGRGRVSIFDADSLDEEPSLEEADVALDGRSSSDALGSGLGGADVDGDGYDDLFVGAPGQDDYADNGGCWYQISGGSTWTTEDDVEDAEDRTVSGAVDDGGVGFGAPAFADFNEDGFVDLAFGGFDVETVWVFYGFGDMTSNLDTSDSDLDIESSGAFGFAVAAADIDADGVEDLVASAPGVSSTYAVQSYWYQAAGSGYGAVSIFDGAALRSGTLNADTGAWVSISGENTGDLFGGVMSAGADVDGDGADDILVAAPRADNAAGRVYRFDGR